MHVATASPIGTSQSSWVLDLGKKFMWHQISPGWLVASESLRCFYSDSLYILWCHSSGFSFRFPFFRISFVPELSMNFLCIGQVINQNYFVGFDDSFCFIQDRCIRTMIGTGHCRRGTPSLYILEMLHLPSSTTSIACVSFFTCIAYSLAKLHHHLGHLCGSHLLDLINK